MILYLDSTALARLLVWDELSAFVQAQLAVVDVVATSRVSYAEVCDAMARRRDEGRLTEGELTEARDQLDRAWPQFAVLDLDERAAADVTVRHGLRGFAAMHLAAALDLRARVELAPVLFCSFDPRQAAAAEAEGFAVLPQ
jgi:predicted nucleic acid-binding protein